ncbi:La- protein 4 [Mortierella alpina]|nr:La- protein 4 [Mortierella alpina]
MSRSSSYESTTLRNMGYAGPLGNQSINMATSHHETAFSETVPYPHVKHLKATSDQVKDDASVNSSHILSHSNVPGPSDIVLPHQPIYAIPWMMMPMPVMLPPHHPPQIMEPERQEPPHMDRAINGRPTSEASAKFDKEPNAHQERDRLREQLEWYLSPRNLSKDVYLVSKMDTDHWVPISVLADFRRVKELTGNLQEVVDALRRSSAVTVDDTGTMVKPITVDRPRTTLLLRELPEDTTEEEIGAVFAEAGCSAKAITKEVVGNMWFVEFDTAADALAMHNYTRGRYIKGVPIAARIKSTTVLTGGEYVQGSPVAANVGEHPQCIFDCSRTCI